MMDKINELTAGILNAIYPQIVFDAQGLTALLLPSLIAVLIGLVILLLMKLSSSARRFAYVPVVIVLIAMIAANSFFPITLKQIGDFTAQQVQQLNAQTEEAPDTSM